MKKLIFTFCVMFLVLCWSCNQIKNEKFRQYQLKYAFVMMEDWSRILLDNSIIENNVWEKEYARNNHQIIFSDVTGKEFGWYWQYAYTTKRLCATPVYILGKKPWFDTTTISLMPLQISAIDTLSCSFEYNSEATGNYENSLSIWITDKKRSDGSDIACQMVCVYGNVGTEKLGTFKNTVQIDNNIMDEYIYRVEYGIFEMVIFYLNSKESKLKFNLKEYLAYLVEKKYINEQNYVSSVELATSVKWGKGETVFSDFNFKINSK